MHGVFRGLRDLHSIGITHRDIKLSNILIDNDRVPITRVKICDLGSSKKLTSNPKVNAILREGMTLGVTLERIKNEAGVDAYDILATEEEASPNLFKSLSRGAQ